MITKPVFERRLNPEKRPPQECDIKTKRGFNYTSNDDLRAASDHVVKKFLVFDDWCPKGMGEVASGVEITEESPIGKKCQPTNADQGYCLIIQVFVDGNLLECITYGKEIAEKSLEDYTDKNVKAML
ncbi:MAG: hypothetical protein M1821_007785 [Bathelium mastoideum]|nr:MAG: hypothetical protein M1821_007785 [Bathelium mastoideum]